MKRTLPILTALLLAATAALAQVPQTMSYQGVLHDAAGAPLEGPHALAFTLYDAETAGTQLWTETHASVQLDEGVFSVILGETTPLSLPFDNQYWLETTVDGETLPSRVKLTATPYALNAKSVADGAVTAAKIADGAVTAAAIADNAIVGSNGVTVSNDGTTITILGSGAGGGSGWELTGNAGTDPNTNFLGTTDAQPLELRANNQRVMRYEAGSSPNLIGGHSNNSATAGVLGAAVGGGGSTGTANRVTDDFGTVGGGGSNQAGNGSEITKDATYATVGGGQQNKASGSNSTVSGGKGNTASAEGSTVGGGQDNTASSRLTTVGGGGAKHRQR